jgi:hypothetical protein
MMGASVHNGARVTNIPARAPSRKDREIARVSDGPGLTLADKPNESPKIKNVSIRLSNNWVDDRYPYGHSVG